MNPTRRDTIEKLLLETPNDEFLNYALALEFEKDGETEIAIEMLVRLNKNNPDYLACYLKLAQLYADENRIENAIEVLKNGIIISQEQKNRKTEGELNQLLMALED